MLVLLRAAPPQLASNLAYIARFRLASRLVSETSYFYTNLVSAAVRKLTARFSRVTTPKLSIRRTCIAWRAVDSRPLPHPQTFLETAQASQFHAMDEVEFAARLRAKVRACCAHAH